LTISNKDLAAPNSFPRLYNLSSTPYIAKAIKDAQGVLWQCGSNFNRALLPLVRRDSSESYQSQMPGPSVDDLQRELNVARFGKSESRRGACVPVAVI
jgi:hypothetical protein